MLRNLFYENNVSLFVLSGCDHVTTLPNCESPPPLLVWLKSLAQFVHHKTYVFGCLAIANNVTLEC